MNHMPKNESNVEESMIEAAISQIHEMLLNHQKQLFDYLRRTGGTQRVAVAINFDTTEAQPMISSNLRFGEVIKDSVVTKLEDPGQTTLPLEQPTPQKRRGKKQSAS